MLIAKKEKLGQIAVCLWALGTQTTARFNPSQPTLARLKLFKYNICVLTPEERKGIKVLKHPFSSTQVAKFPEYKPLYR